MLTNESIEKRAREILSTLTLKEKIGQLTQVHFSIEETDKLKQEIADGKVGSVILSDTAFAGSEGKMLGGGTYVDEMQKTAVEKSKSKIPVIFGRDVIHGHKVVLPIPLAMSASFNFELVKEAYADMAEEALKDGVSWTFTPMLDMARDPRWGRMIEGPGEDPYVGEQMAKAMIEGIQGEELPLKMAACAKHYIGYGASEGGRDYHKTEISDYSLRNYYLKAFKSAVDSGVATVMSSFNEISGEPTSSSKYLLTDVLRDELGFDGFVVSDWGAIIQLVRQGVAEDAKDAARLSINAGLDMDMVDNCYSDYLEELLNEGKVSMETIDESVLRVLRIKLRLNLFEKPFRENKEYDTKAHLARARELARECSVLLKNSNNILPLGKNEAIAMTGPMLNEKRAILGAWTLDGDTDLSVSIADGLKNASDNVFEVDMFNVTGIQQNKLRNCDKVILALGESHLLSGEAHSMADIELSEEQKALIHKMKKLGKKIIAVISSGRPLALESVENDLDAILYIWHTGSETGNAAADVLFGDYSPSGRLTVSFPRTGGQIPIYYNCPPSGRDCDGYYGIEDDGLLCFNYEDCQGTPLYPFGYGLTYTKFDYSEISAKTDKISMDKLKNGVEFSVTVKNTGNYAAKEVVQCYIRDCKSSMTRPIKELKGAKKVFLDKGESKEICFTLTDKDLGFYGRNGKFTVESGEFIIYIGENAHTDRSIKLTVEQ